MGFDFFDFLSQVLIITFVVVMMMMMIEFVNVKTRGKLLALIEKYPRIQIWIAALLGLIPGCVGIFAVVSFYTHRLVSFGTLLAAAITSLGDEAFFMISFIPKQMLWLVLILFVVAVAAGYIFDWIFPKKTMPQAVHEDAFHLHHDACTTSHEMEIEHTGKKISLNRILSIGLILALIIGILSGFIGHNHSIAESFSIHAHHDCEHSHSEMGHGYLSGENIVFLVIALFSLILLIRVNSHFFEEHIWNHVIKKHFLKIFIWVFSIILIIKIAGLFIDAETFSYQAWGQIILLIFALAIALVPESGPNLIVLFLFIDGVVPFSTLLANSFLQEGHGGLPLLAETPKDFFKLKCIKFVIALLIGSVGVVINV